MSFSREALQPSGPSPDGRTRRHDLYFFFHPFLGRRLSGIAYIRPVILIILLVTVVYGRAATFSFVYFDDPELVFENPVVSHGLSPDGLHWAWCEAWQQSIYLMRPLTLTSHMIDVSLFGRWAGGHHLMNIAWHAATAIMLLLWLTAMTGAPGRSLLVAALFAAHPLGADVAAWAAQRSTTLSAFFFLAALTVYQQYLRRPSRRRWGMVFALFLLAVSAKTSAVALPLTLLLIDRFGRQKTPGRPGVTSLLLEKIPFFVVSIGVVMAGMAVSRFSGEDVPLAAVPFLMRLGNALVTGGVCLVKTVFPAGLCVYYPFPAAIPWWQPVGGLLLLSAVTVVVVLRRSRSPLALFGWLWFSVTLLPGLGFIQAGPWPAWADHYMYLPLIGLLITFVWSAPTGKLSDRGKVLAAVVSMIMVLAYGAAAFRQAGFYRDSKTLFSRALAVTNNNFLAHTGLGNVLFLQGRPQQAEAQFRRALDIKPDSPGAHVNLGLVLAKTGRDRAAADHYRQALLLNPRFVEAHVNLANLLARQGNCDPAIEHYLTALAIRPEAADINYSLGRVLAGCGDLPKAEHYFSQACRLCPDNRRYRHACE